MIINTTPPFVHLTVSDSNSNIILNIIAFHVVSFFKRMMRTKDELEENNATHHLGCQVRNYRDLLITAESTQTTTDTLQLCV